MEDKPFLSKISKDLLLAGIELDKNKMEICGGILQGFIDNMKLDLSSGLFEVANFLFGLKNTFLFEFYTLDEKPNYLEATNGFGDGNVFRGYEIIANAVRYRSGYIGSSATEEEVGLAAIYIYIMALFTGAPSLEDVSRDDVAFLLDLVVTTIVTYENYAKG